MCVCVRVCVCANNDTNDEPCHGGNRYPFWSVAYMSRLLAAVALFAVTGYINSVSAASAGWRTPHIQVLDLDGNVVAGQCVVDKVTANKAVMQ